MNDYEVSRVYQRGRNKEDGLGREVLRDGLSLEGAEAWARWHAEVNPKYDVYVTQTPEGEGFKLVKLIYHFGTGLV